MRTARALRLIRRLKAAGAEVSEWEGEFLESVEGRLGTYGRAFADPEKGARDSALSTLQHRKLHEIGAKVAEAAAPPQTEANAPEADSDAAAPRKSPALTRRQPKPRKPRPRRKPPRRAAADQDDDAR